MDKAKVQQEIEKIEIIDTEAVAEIMSEAGDALTAAQNLVQQAEEAYFNLGGVMAHIYYEGLYKEAGYEGKKGFEEYCLHNLGIAYRKVCNPLHAVSLKRVLAGKLETIARGTQFAKTTAVRQLALQGWHHSVSAVRGR